MQPEGWHWRTVLVPGLLTIAVWLFWFGGILLSWFFFICFPLTVPAIALLAVGLRTPAWRPAIAVTLWAAFALSCYCIPLLLHSIIASVNGSWT